MLTGITKHKRSLFITLISLVLIGVFINIVILLNPANTVDTVANSDVPADVSFPAISGENKFLPVNTPAEESLPLNSPFELAAAEFVTNGINMTLKLLMTEGSHIMYAGEGPYGTDYYTGNLVGEVYDSESRLICTTDLSGAFTEKLIFRDGFGEIFTEDYNGDGRCDFTIGQYVSSNYHTFNIFTVQENGQIVKLPVRDAPDGILSSNFDGYYSTRFLKTAGKGIRVNVYDMQQGLKAEKFYSWTGKEFVNIDKPKINENQLDKTKTKLADGTYVKSKDLILRLDKSDETVKNVYESFPEKIKVGHIYEGSFSGTGKKELLVIFKFLDMPHAGGLDFSVAGIFDKNNLSLVSQKSFITDEAQFNLLKDKGGRQYLIYSGATTYQGQSSCTLQVFNLSENWREMLTEDYSVFGEGSYKFRLMPDGIVSVLEPVFEENDAVDWNKSFYFKWNPGTAVLESFIPNTFKDSKGVKYFDRLSVSPDEKYALIAHEWGFDRESYVLLYNISGNRLIHKYNLLGQDFGFNWSEDSKRVAVSRAARIWIDTCVIEIDKNDYISMMDNNIAGYGKFIASGVKFDYKLNENRPDPYIQFIDWSPDGRRLLMHYQWTDSEYNRQNGTFIYDLSEDKVSEIIQNEPVKEGGNIPPRKPDGFSW